MHRVSGQPSFLDAMIEAEGLGRNAELEAIDAAIVWSELGAVVGRLYAAPEGRPSYPPLVMVKALLIQQWYGLSDPRLEFLLRDSLSMRRFVGLAASDGAPDHSTVSRFRSALREAGLDEALFAALNQQLEARGLVVKAGTILDATLVKAAVAKPRKEATGAKNPREPDADWTIKNGRSHFGYKAHIGVDQGSGLIRKARLTPAKTAESLVADGLINGDERAVYADNKLSNGKLFSDCMVDGVKCGPDGLRCDVQGNLWASSNAGRAVGYNGVLCFNPEGKLIGRIRLPEVCGNVCFGGPKRNRLFMAASQSIYAVYLGTQGAGPG